MRILGVSGSLRNESFNKALLEEARVMLPARVTMQITDISNLPIYNRDMESDLPVAVRVFKEEIRETDAILFASPEYNRLISAALRNVIEWGNRPEDYNVWDGKPAAIISASTGVRGGARSQLHLRQVLVDLNICAMKGPELFLGDARQAFDLSCKLIDERAKARLKSVVEHLVDWTTKIRSGSSP
jgi:chromate reductase, NAD(P)H dehydrogenase (quinone)